MADTIARVQAGALREHIGREVGILTGTLPFRGTLSDVQPMPFRQVRLFLGGEVRTLPSTETVLVAI